MDEETKQNLQHEISQLKIKWFESLHGEENLPKDFRPWSCDLSPSALYNCSLKCRKQMNINTPETKWVSLKRWATSTSSGIELPVGVWYSTKREERFVALPEPHYEKRDFILLLFPYGNVWSQKAPDVPINEEDLFEKINGIFFLERLMNKDAAFPIKGYFEKVYHYLQKNPDQVGIHLKRKKSKKSQKSQ